MLHVLVVLLGCAAERAPSALLVNGKRSPALGIIQAQYSWIVPHISRGNECAQTAQFQIAYQVQVSLEGRFESSHVWDSGQFVSDNSQHVQHPNHAPLRPLTRYFWRVRTWSSTSCASYWSEAATFVTAPQPLADPIWAPGQHARFVLLRQVLSPPSSPYVRGTAFVTAETSNEMEKLLGAYRLYIGGEAAAIGPGRGEVRTAAYRDGGDKNHTQFDSVDISSLVRAQGGSSSLCLALQCYHTTGGADAMVGMQVLLEHADGSSTVVSADRTWRAFDATVAFGPGLSEGPNTVCYTAPQENTDARLLPRGWQRADFAEASHGAGWAPAAAKSWGGVPGSAPMPKRTLPLALEEGVAPAVFEAVEPNRRYFADFGSNLMGGLRLRLEGGPAAVAAAVGGGARMQVTMSEELVDSTSRTLLYPMRTGNHYRSVWTAGPGPGTAAKTAASTAGTASGEGGDSAVEFEHHEFKLFRYVEVLLLGDASAVAFNTTNTCQEVAVDESSQGSRGSVATLSVHCPQGGGTRLIDAVRFASFGAPAGACKEVGKGDSPNDDCSGEEHGGGGCGDSFVVDPSCHATSSKALVEKQCVGKPSCTLSVTSAFFGADSCPPNATKRLAVDVTCGNVTRNLDTLTSLHEPPALQLQLSAWTVRYPYVESDSSFTSSDDMLNRVWNLSVNTLRVTSLDTATDSNTRERLPYEGDGLITGHSRLSLQREYNWPRHSWLHNLWNPTSPTEWRQSAALLVRMDHEHSGSLELFHNGVGAAALEEQSQLPCVDAASQLPNFTSCARCNGGLGCPRESALFDLIDTPAVGSGEGYRDGYVLSDTSTVVAAYLVGALRALAALHAASGNATHASRLSARANATQAAVNSLCFDNTSGLYTDGAAGPARRHSALHASVFPAAFGLVPRGRWRAILDLVRRKRMAGSVYAAYWILVDLEH